MFASLLRLIDSPAPLRAPHTRLSVAVLLLEAARQDDHFDQSERAVIQTVLTKQFHLSSQY
jgi:uncharacterized tellurite resistance protein B-like protein